MTMTDPFEIALAELLGIEGGFSDIAEDRGGKTNWGITEGVARGEPYNYGGDMRNLPVDLMQRIYREGYWDVRRLQLSNVATTTSTPIASEIFEQAVNTGVYRTGKRVQRVLNVLNRDEKLYEDMTVDGWLWSNTVAAMTILSC